MAISFGPKLNLLYNALIGESYFDSLRLFLQSIDALVQGSVINATQVSPPTSPNPGDAYLLIGGTPGGAWTGQAGNIAVWDAQLTSSGTNTVVPGWIFLTPKAGWVIWNVALGSLVVYNGTSWNGLTGGANFPTNTNITSMTGIPNTTIDTTGYIYNDGTNPVTSIGDATAGGAGPNGLQWGTGSFSSPTSVGTVIIGLGPWTGLDATGVGIGISSLDGSTAVTAEGLQTDGTIEGGTFIGLDTAQFRASPSIQVTEVQSYGNSYPGAVISFSSQISPATTAGPAIVVQGGGAASGSGNAFGFSTYPVQTTIGSTGSASALPALPTGYLQIWINGTLQAIPFYAVS